MRPSLLFASPLVVSSVNLPIYPLPDKATNALEVRMVQPPPTSLSSSLVARSSPRWPFIAVLYSLWHARYSILIFRKPPTLVSERGVTKGTE